MWKEDFKKDEAKKSILVKSCGKLDVQQTTGDHHKTK